MRLTVAMDFKNLTTAIKSEKWYKNKGYFKDYLDVTATARIIKKEDTNGDKSFAKPYKNEFKDNKRENTGCVDKHFGVLSEIKSEGLETIDYEKRYFDLINKLKYERKPEWIPLRSPHNLVEEVLYQDPWALLVATIFLNRTSCSNARPYIFWFLFENPYPSIVLKQLPEDLLKYFRFLGLQNTRAHQLWRMTKEYVYKDWRHVHELFGIGRYGSDAFKMFCLGDFTVEPKDRFLRIYKAWYENIGKNIKESL